MAGYFTESNYENAVLQLLNEEPVSYTHLDKDHVHNHLIFNAVDFLDYHAYKSYKRIYYDMREVSDRLCKENGLSVKMCIRDRAFPFPVPRTLTEKSRNTSRWM